MEEKTEGRTNIEDLPRDEEELTSDEAKDVQGGALSGIKVWTGPVQLSTPGNTVGGSLGGDISNPTKP